MEDFFLETEVDDELFFVTTLSEVMYRQIHKRNNGLGGAVGYFICSSVKGQPEAGFSILAKAASFEAAEKIFWAICRPVSQNDLTSA